MQHHAPLGYPTPPASPAYDNFKCGNNHQQTFSSTSFHARCIPLAPEQRLGRFLEGKLQLTAVLGTGAYGVVYSAIDIKTGVRYAVKCLSKYNADGTPLERRQVAYQQREIRLHYLASAHPNIVSMLKIVDDPDCVYVILEYCPEGDLFLNITELGQYVAKDQLSKKIFLQILDAVEHCHKLGIYHRDLKPENILVTDNGNTVKLADFGLATSDSNSEDYGCGSTFYMSPECLNPSTRKPYYMCAPNDVWSLGVILVNLTCGRNPWKQASCQDSTYRAYTRSRDFLKSILPLTDDLNDILGRIFNPNPELRITLAELRCRIRACSRFTVPAVRSASLPQHSVSPHNPEYVTDEDAIADDLEYLTDEDAIVDDYELDSPLSPASTTSNEGSLTSSGSTIDDLDDDDFAQEQQDIPVAFTLTATYELQDTGDLGLYHDPGMPHTFHDPVAMPIPMQVTPQPAVCQQSPMPVPAPCQPKSFFPLWEVVRYVQQVPMMQHPVAFQQVPFIPSFQGCY
ncbi:Ran1-like protein kinase [Metarhizium rileyi]|uniref:Autophagy-related protein 1 n=1 Tax=Metarhizium rileyi (strain RCEF 4871) TaxID=1649241 RepID=A0A166X057_METRR|nr:Ran1-like protein kinase [Metarhizium rileyi RCEF 4871]